MGNAFIDAVVGVLNELKVEPSDIDVILSMLDEGETEIPTSGMVEETDASMFGGLPGGTAMAYHSDMARQFMVDSMMDVLKTFSYYRDSVVLFVKKANDADNYSHDDFLRYRRAVERAQHVNDRQQPDYKPYGRDR